MRISDWSSDVCSSDLPAERAARRLADDAGRGVEARGRRRAAGPRRALPREAERRRRARGGDHRRLPRPPHAPPVRYGYGRSEEHTSELQSLMRISYAVFCLKKKKHRV